MKKNRNPILYKGEQYSSSVVKKTNGGPKSFPFTWEVAREKIVSDVDRITADIKRLPASSRLPNEVIMCVRMHPDFSAKSYYPTTLFDGEHEKFGLQEVGSRIWRHVDTEENESEVSGKLFFVRATENSLSKLKRQLQRDEGSQKKNFTEDVRKLIGIDLLSSEEQLASIPSSWNEGTLEAVLHPFDLDGEIALKDFIKTLQVAGADISKIKYKQYKEGITFVSLYGDREIVSSLSGYNPLRTLHPLRMRDVTSIHRGFSKSGAPYQPDFIRMPSVTVGVIDGGYIPGNPMLDPYVIAEDWAADPGHAEFLHHGTEVTGAVLYGALNGYNNKDKLPEPNVKVKNFRVLSDGLDDPDLYDVIDAIEEIVPSNRDIKVYNLSIGPVGQILDDHISRFTFACDYLSHNYGVIFCAAVGNDGELAGYNRIQSPADMINGLAVAAYNDIQGAVNRAPYSCIGPGREGNKLKPDLAAFGGCSQNPIQLVGAAAMSRTFNQGTSFASPIVASAVAQLIGYSNENINNLIARALIIHGVAENRLCHNVETGHGLLTDDLQNFISCPDKSYTLIYTGEIEQGKYIELNIPWINEIEKGKANFRWTLTTLTNVDVHSPDDYSTSSIMLSFYPNSKKYLYKKDNKTTTVDIQKDPEKAIQLTNEGWIRDSFPKSESGQTPYQVENELRADFKWDTVDARRKNKTAGHVTDPFFHLHALGRGHRYSSDKVKYALVLTVEASGTEIDIYNRVSAKYSALVPLRLNMDTEIRISA